jgi:hypothetical protein
MFDIRVKVIVFLFIIAFEGSSSVVLRSKEEVKEYLHLFRTAKRDKRDAPPPPGPVNATQAPVPSTTYDWHQWTRTYPTGQPGTRTTYDWHQWTTTGAPTNATSPGTGSPDPTAVTTETPETTTESHEYRCAPGKYGCKGTIGLCINLSQICDGKQDCPHRDDEDKRICFPGFDPRPLKKNYNNFAGTGFMFNIKNLVVKGSKAKLFEQQSDNLAKQSQQVFK